MSTGNFENWAGNIAELGPVYPFVGLEWLMVLIGVALWLLWHFLQSSAETRTYEEELRRHGGDEGLREALMLEEADTSEKK